MAGHASRVLVRARAVHGGPQRVLGLYSLPAKGVFAATNWGIYRLAPNPAMSFQSPDSLFDASAWTDGHSVWYATTNAIYRDGVRVGAIPAPPEYTSSVITTTALLDREGSVWLGTIANGLHRLSASLFTTYSVSEGIANQNVYPV